MLVVENVLQSAQVSVLLVVFAARVVNVLVLALQPDEVRLFTVALQGD